MTGASRKDAKTRSIKMGLVEEIENLGPELHIDPLAWFESLVRGKIDIHKVGPREGVSSQVAPGPSWRPRKGAGIVPQVRRTQGKRLSGLEIKPATRHPRRGVV